VAAALAAPASARAAPPPERPRLAGSLVPAIGTSQSVDSFRSNVDSSPLPHAVAQLRSIDFFAAGGGAVQAGDAAATVGDAASSHGAPSYSQGASTSGGLGAAWLAASVAAGSPRSASPLLRRSGSPARGGGGALRPAPGAHAQASARAHQHLQPGTHAAAAAAAAVSGAPAAFGAAASAMQALLLPGSPRPAPALGAAAGGRSASPFASAMRERAKQHSLTGRLIASGSPGVGGSAR